MYKNGEEICCCRKSRTEIGVVRRICGGGVRDKPVLYLFAPPHSHPELEPRTRTL